MNLADLFPMLREAWAATNPPMIKFVKMMYRYGCKSTMHLRIYSVYIYTRSNVNMILPIHHIYIYIYTHI